MRTSTKQRHALVQTSLLTLLAAAWLSQVGCGGNAGPTVQIPADPRSAGQTELESLFDQISVQLSVARPGSEAAATLQTQRTAVGGELAQRAAAAIRTRLSQVSRVDGLLPLGALERESAAVEAVRRYDADVFEALRDELAAERASTRKALAENEDRLSKTGAEQLLDRINLLSALSALSGTGSEEQARYAAQRDEILLDVSRDAEEAIRNEDFERAQSLLGIVAEVNPGDASARRQKCEIDGKVIVQRFNHALETGRVGRTAAMLQDFAETDCFHEIKRGLATEAAPLAEAFGLLGQESVEAGELADAYRRYQDARLISRLLLERKSDLPGVDAFLQAVDARFQRAFDASEFGVAWGLLDVMTEFGPTTPQARQRLRKTRDEIARRAVRGLTAYPFEDPPTSDAQVGDAVSSKVVQHIFQTIPSDVRIVEREQLERILEECERRGTCSDLDTADFIVQGTILDAKVETTAKVGRETRRVVTGQRSVANPEYTAWTQLKDKDREKAPAPPMTIRQDVTEDVTIEVNNVRKVGIISVAYRVVEASSGQVLYTDSLQTKQEFEDEGREGVQLGDFKQETDFVELPPDIEILSGSGGLADRISEEIGVKLVDFLKDPEEQYAREARRFVNEGDFIGAARRTAYSIVLREEKGKDLGSLKDDLKTYAIDAPAL